jgi:hypothetical protein
MFSKAQIKGEGQPVDEYRELSDKEKLVQAQLYVKSLKKKIDNIEGDAMLYRRLRQLEVIIMAEDGAKYLQGQALDNYLDNLPHRGAPALNKAFSDEYAEGHADKLAEHFDKEAVRNVKT